MKQSSLLAMVSLGAGLAAAGCNDRPTPADSKVIPFQEVFKDRYSGITIQRGEVISTLDRWQTVWNEITGTQFPQPPLPVVDFGNASVILVAMGENGDACWTVQIEAVREEGAQVHITAANIRSPQSCSCPAVVVQPVHVVSVQTTAPSAVFDVRTTTRGAECN